MPLTQANIGPVNTARTNARNAMITFCTSTLPPLATAAHNAVAAISPENNTFDEPEEAALYNACCLYVRQLIAKGAYTGAPLPYR